MYKFFLSTIALILLARGVSGQFICDAGDLTTTCFVNSSIVLLNQVCYNESP